MEELHLEGQPFVPPQGFRGTEADFPPLVVADVQQKIRNLAFRVLERAGCQFFSLVLHIVEGEGQSRRPGGWRRLRCRGAGGKQAKRRREERGDGYLTVWAVVLDAGKHEGPSLAGFPDRL